MKHQQGIVLFFALVVLLVLTVIGTSLAVSAGFSARMASTSAERVEAFHMINGAQLRLIEDEASRAGDSRFVTVTGTDQVTDASLNVNSDIEFNIETGCRRSSTASSASLFGCRHLDVTSRTTFGRNNRGNVAVVSAVEQPVFNIGG
ncbi:PilX N-terminal domain-containing pilus assembly protein [Paraferrimonas sedimenticola]|uniref:Type 4 fimbrial biogenesis protein PilX N-terminal domain-containing protein n=1 Tax=Paraferrimonas sedimenticola TaxID=375674 RepID=A0AA37RYR9_9GAMM|nr:PilX N-terminal domain-containing pilus assembly protein [Paraferrimonas sedimenticola]GLP97142.1 hypothetical protein GCM10007895_24490 [Paraferrimonas sedimenticola]